MSAFRNKEQEASRSIIDYSFECHGLYTVISAFNQEMHQDQQANLVQYWPLRSPRPVNQHRFIRFTLPWSEHPVLTFYHRCLEAIGIDQIEEWAGRGTRGVLTYDSPLLKQVLSRLAHLDQLRPANSSWRKIRRALLWAYLNERCSLVELRKLGLPRNLTTEERFMLLHTLCLCQPGRGVPLEEQTRLWIFVDQVEGILDYSAREQGDLRRSLALLMANQNLQLTLWLNISNHGPARNSQIINCLGSDLLFTFVEDLTDLTFWGEDTLDEE